MVTSINALDIRGQPIYIEISGQTIKRIDNKHHDEVTLNLVDQVVLPPIIDAHNHPLPYNLSDADNLMGSDQARMGTFTSRFEWNGAWRAKSDEIMDRQGRLRAKDPAYANCAMFYYTSFLDVGAAVIQGYDAEYFKQCMVVAGDALLRVRPESREAVWIWKDKYREQGRTAEMSARARELATGQPMVVHLAEGESNNSDVQKEVELAYFAGILGRGGGVYIHGTGFTAEDLDAIQQSHGGIIWSPVSQVALYGKDGTLDVKSVLEKGVLVGLGADWALTGSPNILREMAAAQRILEEKFDYSEEAAAELTLQMATSSNAKLFGLQKYDAIAVGKIASLTFVPKSEILPGGQLDLKNLDETDVTLSLHRGRAVLGDIPVMKKLDPKASPVVMSPACTAKGIAKAVAGLPAQYSLTEVTTFVQSEFPNAPEIFRCE